MTYNVFGGTLNLAQSMTYNVLQLIPHCYAMSLTFDPLTLNVCIASAVTRSDSASNFSDIEQYYRVIAIEHLRPTPP